MTRTGITIFTDGSSRGNPGPGGWGSVLVMNDYVTELGAGESHTTNNRMELTAAVCALGFVAKTLGGSSATPITLYTDSKYLINGATAWVYGWQKNGWKTGAKEDVVNQDLWQALLDVMRGQKIDWQYVGGHVGIAGNERCDVIATAFADGMPPHLYTGTLDGYNGDILNIGSSADLVVKKKASKSGSGAKAYSYVSLVGGEIRTHASWVECEARVKGAKGARYKKTLSPEDEKAIIFSFSS